MKFVLICALVFLSILGCSLKMESVSPAPAPAPAREENFEISSLEKEKLAAVNCQLSQMVLNCSDPDVDAFSSDRLASLTLQKTKLEARMLVFKELQVSLDSQIKSGSLAGSKLEEARTLSLAMSWTIGECVTLIAGKELEIIKEKQYLIVLGTKCQGSYSDHGSLQKIDELISVPNQPGSDYSKAFGTSGPNQFNGHLVSAEGTRVRWSAVDRKADLPDSGVEHFVESDGEFSLRTGDAAKLSLDCFRRRGDSDSFKMTNRPIKKRILNCKAEFLGPVRDGLGKQNLSGEMSISVSENDEGHTSEIGVKADPHWADGDYSGLNYAVRHISNKGVIKFEAYNFRTEQVLMELTTVNSTPRIAFGFSDQEGNSLKIDCGDVQ
jgi:hypothetical protein